MYGSLMEAVIGRFIKSHFLDHPSMDNVDSTLKSYFLAENTQKIAVAKILLKKSTLTCCIRLATHETY